MADNWYHVWWVWRDTHDYSTNHDLSYMKSEGSFPGLAPLTAGELGRSGEPGVSYVLKWETLPSNRDRARPEPWPGPSVLYLFKLKSQGL